MHTLWVLIVGAVIGAIAGALTSKGQSMGWIANIVAGLVGSFIGEKILGSWSSRSRYGNCAINYWGSNFSCCGFILLRTKK